MFSGAISERHSCETRRDVSISYLHALHGGWKPSKHASCQRAGVQVSIEITAAAGVINDVKVRTWTAAPPVVRHRTIGRLVVGPAGGLQVRPA